MKSVTTIEAAMRQAATTIASTNVQGLLGDLDEATAYAVAFGSLNVTWRRGWAIEASINVSFDNDPARFEEGGVIPRVSINWPSTHREIPNAIAFLSLAREVTELAALIESQLAELKIVFAREPA